MFRGFCIIRSIGTLYAKIIKNKREYKINGKIGEDTAEFTAGKS